MSRDTTDRVERAPSLDRDGRAAYRVRTNGGDLSAAIVEAVAAVADCDPTANGVVLYDVVDPDALDHLFSDRPDGTPRAAGRVVFDLRGCRVEVHADSEPVVYEPDDNWDESPSPSVGST